MIDVADWRALAAVIFAYLLGWLVGKTFLALSFATVGMFICGWLAADAK